MVEKGQLSNNKVQIEVQIRDTGIGIPERDQRASSRLSARPMRAFPSSRRTGLGLVIAQKLVKRWAAIFPSKPA
ncbi:ATP-binding protein [Shigella flexneri]